MYIWVILATFMVALYSFNLSYRSDIRSVEVEPLARALVSKLIIKQQAAGNYIYYNTPPRAKIIDGEGNVVEADTVTYSDGVLSEEDLQPSEGITYLPFGYKNDNSVISEIYCLDKDNYQVAKDCSSPGTDHFLVSYMPIPQRWLNVKTGLPNNDLLAAMKDLVGDDSGFGYPVCQRYIEDTATETKKCDQLVIRSREGLYKIIYDEDQNSEVSDEFLFEIPYYIAQNGEFSQTCNKDNTDNLCLVYIYEYKSAN